MSNKLGLGVQAVLGKLREKNLACSTKQVQVQPSQFNKTLSKKKKYKNFLKD